MTFEHNGPATSFGCSFRGRGPSVWAVFALALVPSLMGCGIGGDSLQDQMLQRAKAKAEIKRAEEAEQKQLAAERAKAEPKPRPKQPSESKTANKPKREPKASENTPAASGVATGDSDNPRNRAPQESGPQSSPAVPPPSERPEIEFAASGTLVAFERPDQSIGLFDVQSQQLSRVLGGDAFEPTTFALDATGKLLIAGDASGGVKTYDLATVEGIDAFQKRRMLERDNAPPRYAHGEAVQSVAPMGYSDQYVTGDGAGKIRLWRQADPEPVELRGAGGRIVGFERYGDGRLLFAAVGTPEGGKAVFWRTADEVSEQDLPTDYLELEAAPTHMTRISDGSGLAIGTENGEVHLWLPQEGRVARSALQAPGSPITGLAFTGGGKAIVTGDEAGNVLRWALPVSKRRSLDTPRPVSELIAIADDGKILLVNGPAGFADLIDTESGELIHRIPTGADATVTGGCFLDGPEGLTVATANSSGVVLFAQAERGERLGQRYVNAADRTRLTATPDGKRLAFYGSDGSYGVLAPPSGINNLEGQGAVVDTAIASADQSEVLTVSQSGRRLRVLNPASGQVVGSTLVTQPDESIETAYVNDGVAVLGSDGGSLLLWEYRKLRARPTYFSKQAHEHAVMAVTLGADGEIYSCDSQGNVIRHPRGDKEQQASDVLSLGRELTSAQFTADGLLARAAGGVVLFGLDGKVKFRTRVPEQEIVAAALAPRGDRVAVVDASGRLFVTADGSLGDPLQLPIEEAARSVGWSRNGSSLLVSTTNLLLEIDAERGEVVAEYGSMDQISRLCGFDGEVAVFLGDRGNVASLRLAVAGWRGADPVVITAMDSNRETGSLFAATDSGEIWELEAASGSTLSTRKISDAALTSIVVSPATSGVVAADEDGLLWDGTDPKLAKQIEVALNGKILALSRDAAGEQIALWTNAGDVAVADFRNVANAAPMELKGDVQDALFFSSAQLCLAIADKTALEVMPTAKQSQAFSSGHGTVTGLISLGGGSAVAVADSTDTVTLLDATGASVAKQYRAEGLALQRLAASISGTHLVAIGPYARRISGTEALAVWDLTGDSTEPKRIELSGSSTCLACSPDGSYVAVGFEENVVRIFDSATGGLREVRSLDDTPTSINTSDDGDSLFVGTSGGDVLQLRILLQEDVQLNSGSINQLLALDKQRAAVALADDRVVIVPFRGGKQSVEQAIVLQEESIDARAAAIWPDGPMIGVTFGGDSPHLKVWRLNQEIPWGRELKPSVEIPLPLPADSVRFLDSGRVLVGDEGGTIRLWTLADQKEVYRFSKHESPVETMTVVAGGNQLLSCSADRSVRRWQIPADVQRLADGDVPVAEASATTRLNDLAEPEPSDVENLADDPFAEVRQVLLSKSQDPKAQSDIFRLFKDDASLTSDVAKSFEAMQDADKLLQASSTKSALDQLDRIAAARQDFYRNRRQLTSLQRVAGGMTYADEQANLLFSTPTEFNFSTGVRRVELQLTEGRYVYAAQPSSDRTLGALFSWDFGVSGVQTHAWEDVRANIRELFALPQGQGVFSVPDLYLFAQDGRSRRVSRVARWAVSPDHGPFEKQQFFAVANKAVWGQESVMLQVYSTENLLSQSAKPYAALSGFESEITAMAFARNHRALAFSVRERTGYRLYIADPTSLNVREIVALEEGTHDQPWVQNPEFGQTGNRPIPGPTSLAFSPDDRFLVVHGNHGEQGRLDAYRYSVWRLNWADDGSLSQSGFSRIIDPVEKEKPFIDENSSQSIRFVTRTLPPDERDESGNRYAHSPLIAFKYDGSLVVVNAVSGEQIRKIKLKQTQGRTEFATTADGQWLIMGDDRGQVSIVKVGTGRTYNLTSDDRPAHAGPVVGVALSETNAVLGFPEYAVTVGEENRLKVWDLISRLR